MAVPSIVEAVSGSGDDRWSLKFAPLTVPDLSKSKFSVEIFATPGGFSTSIASD
jgi:hypothetical protein